MSAGGLRVAGLLDQRAAATSLTILSFCSLLGEAAAMPRTRIVSLSLLAGALGHLALVLPNPSAPARFAPAAVVVPYVVCILPAGLGLRTTNGGFVEAGRAVEAVIALLLATGSAALLGRLGRAFARDVDPDSYRVRFMIAGVGVSGTSLFGWWLSGRDDGLLAIACLALPLSTWLAIAGEPASPRSLASAWRGPVDSCLSVEQIARGIAHSMLKPVTAAAQRLRSAVPRTIDSQLCSDLMAALELMDHTQRLIRDLLDLARSQGHLERREVKVQPVLHQAVAQVQQRFPHAQIDLRSTSGVAFADEVLVRCALVNLIENALEAQGGSGWVSVRAEHDGHHARLVVEDRAGGLPVEVEERLFEPFVTTKSGGTGLGLAVVHEVCRAHGGSVTRQRTGDGTRFVVTLPSRSRARSQRVRVIRP